MNLDTKLRCSCGKERSLYEFMATLGYKREEMVVDFLKFAPQVRELLPKLQCSSCRKQGQIKPVLKTGKPSRQKRASFSSRLVATDRGLNRIFHKQSCSYAKRINRRDEVFFDDRDKAIKMQFAPCKFCRP